MKLNNTNNTKTTSMIRRFAMAALMTFAATALNAEGLPIHVTIPFAFTAGGKVMPAGEYSIKPIEGFSGAVTFHSMVGGANLIALATSSSDSIAKSTLEFAVADAGRALTKVSAPGWTVNFTVPAPLKLAKRMEVPGVLAFARAR